MGTMSGWETRRKNEAAREETIRAAERARIRQLVLAERDHCLETANGSAEDYWAAAVLTRVAALLEDR